MAFTSVSFSIVISVPGATSLPSTSHVLNSWFSDGAPKAFSGNLYFSPFLTVAESIEPVPVFPLNVTLYLMSLCSMSFQMAFTVVSPVIFIFSPGCFRFVESSPICQPENSLLAGGVNVLDAGNSYSVFAF